MSNTKDVISSTMLQHLVQNRWNHVRTIEAQYHTDKENISLKKEITSLKDEIKNIKDKSNKNIKDAMLIVSGWIKTTRSQFKNNKIKQMDEIKDAHRSLNQVQEWVQRSLNQMIDEIQILKKSNKILKEERDLALEQSSSSSQLRSQEIQKLREKIAKLSTENVDFEQRNTMLSSDLKKIKEVYEDTKNEKAALHDKYEELYSDSKKLRQWISKMEAEGLRTAADAKESERKLSIHYESLLNNLASDNHNLRIQINELQNEIINLRNELSGNKNHFAKFVKLKTENVSLASKLNQVTKTIKSAEVAGIKTLNSKEKHNKLSLDFSGLPPAIGLSQVSETGRNSTSRTGRTADGMGPPLTARSLVRHQIEQYKQQQLMENQQKHLIQEYIRESQPSPTRNPNEYDDMRLDITPRRHEYEEMIASIVSQRIHRSNSPVEIKLNDNMQNAVEKVEQNLVRQLSIDILKTKESNDDGIYSFSVGKPRPPSAHKKFETVQRTNTPNNPIAPTILNGRVLI